MENDIYDFVEATKYKDVIFRSKLEAHWAAFFDLCKWEWTYEPNIDSKNWLPDFKMKGYSQDYFVEVKPIDWQKEIFKAPSISGVVNYVLETREDLEKVRTSGLKDVLVLGLSPFVFPKQLKREEHVFGGVWNTYPDEEISSGEALFECFNGLCGWRSNWWCHTFVGPDIWGSSEGARALVYTHWKAAGAQLNTNVIPFGKYKGQSWKVMETDIPYCKWVLGVSELKEKYSFFCDYVDWVVTEAEKGTL